MLSDDTEKNYIYENLLYAVKSFENPIALCGLTKKFWHFFFFRSGLCRKRERAIWENGVRSVTVYGSVNFFGFNVT